MIFNLFPRIQILVILFGASIFGAPNSFALEFSVGNSASSTSQTQSLSLSQKFLDAHRLSLGFSRSKDTSITTDGEASSIKGSYGYRFVDSGLSLKAGAKRSNDYYSYESAGVDAKVTYPIFEWTDEDKTTRVTRLGLKADSQIKSYSKLKNETYSQNSFNIGLEQDLNSEWSVGLDSSLYFYSSESTETKNAFQAKATTYSDISNTVNQTSKSDIGIDVDYSGENFSSGLNISKSNPQVAGQSSYVSYEVYVEYTFFEALTASVNWNRGKSETSTSYSDSWGFSFGWNP